MALVKYMNYYIDDDGYYRRIPWDSWILDGNIAGVSPVGVMNQNAVEYDSYGNVTINEDFLDYSGDLLKPDRDIMGMNRWTDEREFTESYENVIGFYDSDSSQSYEFDYDRKEFIV